MWLVHALYNLKYIKIVRVLMVSLNVTLIARTSVWMLCVLHASAFADEMTALPSTSESSNQIQVHQENNAISSLEWHGEASSDIYNIDTAVDGENAALSGLREGTFSLTTLQGDLRLIEQLGDVSYAQGSISMTRDRAKQSLYSSQINNVQLGRAGIGYQLSAGDVVADFSKIGSSLGLRGVYGAKQVNALTLYGFAGTQSDSWEALINRTPITNQPARSRFLRDVAGVKLNYQIDQQWTLFGTAQTYHDRKSSLNSVLAASQIAQKGHTGTTGIVYKGSQATFSAEFGGSQQYFDDVLSQDHSDAALLLDAAYAWQIVSVNAGYHNLGARYTALAGNIAPGIRETFIASNWQISPTLTYGNDVRRTDSRTANLLDNLIAQTRTDTLTNRINYTVSSIPSLNISLQDSRNWTETALNTSRNTSTQLTTAYANQHYSGGIVFNNARQRTNNNPESNSMTDGVQINLGRQVQEGELVILPALSGGVQFYGGYQQQRIANGTQTSNATQGISMNARSQKIGQLQLGLSNTDTRQPNGRSTLNTKAINLDWSKTISQALAFKAYIHNNYRNHGDTLQTVDEKIMGIQGDYQW
jgi:hypothetical protein